MLTPTAQKTVVVLAGVLLASVAIVSHVVLDVSPVVTLSIVVAAAGLLIWQLHSRSPYAQKPGDLHLNE